MEQTPTPAAASKQDNRALPIRTDTVGMFFDGYDYIANNPPGFAVAVALEQQKEDSRR